MESFWKIFNLIIFTFYKAIVHLSFYCHRYLLPKLKPGECEILNIVYRRKLGWADNSWWTDFFGIRARIAKISEIKEDSAHWIFHAVSETDAYFVQLPRPVAECQAVTVPFFFDYAFRSAEAVARVPLDTFMRSFARRDRNYEDPVLIGMSPRSGSTLLSQILEVEGVSVAFAEWDPVHPVQFFLQEGLWPEELADSVLTSAINSMLCRFISWLSPTFRSHAGRVKKVGATNSWDFTAIYVVLPYKVYVTNKDSGMYSHPLIHYEDVVAPHSCVELATSIFKACGFPKHLAEGNIRKRLRTDSQAGTPLTTRGEAVPAYRAPDRQQIQRMNEIASYLGFGPILTE